MTRDFFRVTVLNEVGATRTREVAAAFDACLTVIEELAPSPDGRTMAIVRSKMQEAFLFSQQALQENPFNIKQG